MLIVARLALISVSQRADARTKEAIDHLISRMSATLAAWNFGAVGEPKAVINVVRNLHGDAFVERHHFRCGHAGGANGKRVLLPLREDRNRGANINGIVERSAVGGETWAHDVGTTKDEFDGTTIDSQSGHHRWEALQQMQRWEDGTVACVEELDHL
jgi:hypothetical protein